MLQKRLFNSLKSFSLIKIFLIIFFSSLIISILVAMLAKSSIFVIAFLSLFLALPISKYLDIENKQILNEKLDFLSLFQRYEKEIFIFWIIFIIGIIIFYILNILSYEFFYQENMLEEILIGNFIFFSDSFFNILSNNLLVLLVTFILTAVISSSLIFILLWNSSVISYFLYNSSNLYLNLIYIFPHLLLESGGYILGGFAGTLLSYKISNNTNSKIFIKDFVFIIILSILFICFGAILETL